MDEGQFSTLQDLSDHVQYVSFNACWSCQMASCLTRLIKSSAYYQPPMARVTSAMIVGAMDKDQPLIKLALKMVS